MPYLNIKIRRIINLLQTKFKKIYFYICESFKKLKLLRDFK